MTLTQQAHDLYPSRTGAEPHLAPRRDPIVHGASRQGPLSPTQLARYESDGFLLLPGLLDAETVAACLAELARLADSEAVKRRTEAILEPQGRDLRSLFAVHRVSDLFGRLAADDRLCGIARQLLGGEVYIHQSRVNLKPGFVGKEFYWHSDFETWHVEDGMPRMRALSCTVLLSENNEFNGPLLLMPESHMHYISCAGRTPPDHYKHSLKKQEYGIADPTALKLLCDRGGIQSMKGPAGSVVFFDCNTMHGSNSNISPYPRANLFMVYNSVENRLGDPRGGLEPRPEFIAARRDCAPLVPIEPGDGAGS